MNYQKLIEECDAYVRAGQDQKVVRAISELEIAKIPRQWRLPLATLCRRVAQIATGLKILSFVASTSKNAAKPTSPELAEYGALLQKFGAVDDGLRLLTRVNEREVPEALMFRAVCHFSRWEYPAAVPLLEKYVTVASTEYQALVGKVNLAAALVAVDELSRAESLLLENIEVMRAKGHARLEGNCHELLTQVHLLADRLAEAEQTLTRAESLISGTGSLDRLFTNKCRAVLRARESRSIEPLTTFRKEAAAWPHAETVRETDLYTLMISRDEGLFDRLYFGTPFEFYRSRMVRLLGSRPKSDRFVLGDPDAPCIDVLTGESARGPRLKPGSSVHKVLATLLRDFYRPARLGNMFGQLFPGEYFDIHSSPARVHQTLRRARKWLDENHVPAEITETDGTYSLRITGPLSFRLTAERDQVDRAESLLNKLTAAFPDATPFTAAAATEALGMTSSSFHRFLAPMLETGRIERYGASTSTVYFIERKTSKAA